MSWTQWDEREYQSAIKTYKFGMWAVIAMTAVWIATFLYFVK